MNTATEISVSGCLGLELADLTQFKETSPVSQFSEIEVTIPEDSKPGDVLTLDVNGKELEVIVPEGATPGTVITIEVPVDDDATPPSLEQEVSPDSKKEPGNDVANAPAAEDMGPKEIEVVVPEGAVAGTVITVEVVASEPEAVGEKQVPAPEVAIEVPTATAVQPDNVAIAEAKDKEEVSVPEVVNEVPTETIIAAPSGEAEQQKQEEEAVSVWAG
eukprot:g18436.t1